MSSNDLTPEPWLDEVLPADEPESKPDLMVALPAPNPPHPNIWWSLLWCFGILATLYGTIIVAMVAGMVGKDVYARIRGEKEPEISADRPLSPEELEKARAAKMAKLKEDLFRSLAFPMLLGEVVTTLLAIATLRIFVGRNWMRIVGLR